MLPILKHILAEKWLFNFSGSKVLNESMHWLVLKEYNEGEVGVVKEPQGVSVSVTLVSLRIILGQPIRSPTN